LVASTCCGGTYCCWTLFGTYGCWGGHSEYGCCSYPKKDDLGYKSLNCRKVNPLISGAEIGMTICC